MNKQQAYNLFMQQALKYGFSLYGPPKTGQIFSYYTGDDGEYQKGYPESGARYIDNDDGTITDIATGLMWTKRISDLGLLWWALGAPTKMGWLTALGMCNSLNYAGYTDWRLPNVTEMHSILDFSIFSPAVNPIFENIMNANYWTSTTSPIFSTWAYTVNLNAGAVGGGDKGTAWYPRPVRGGL